MPTSMNFATVIATFTPKVAGMPGITYKSDVFFNEEEFLSEPQPDKPRARLFMANDGISGQYVDIFAIAGKRDLTLFDSPEADKLMNWAYTNPQPMFDFNFRYQRNDQDDSQVRNYLHLGCKILNHPGRAMSNDITIIKFNLQYSRILPLDSSGQLVTGT